MVLAISLMILLGAVHPPAVATALTFTFQPGAEGALVPFALALGSVVVLVALQRLILWFLSAFRRL